MLADADIISVFHCDGCWFGWVRRCYVVVVWVSRRWSCGSGVLVGPNNLLDVSFGLTWLVDPWQSSSFIRRLLNFGLF